VKIKAPVRLRLSVIFGQGEARLPVEEQLSLKLRRLIEANIPELSVKVRVEKRR
jgi:hypothetical protein